jgi:hypothetical protein
MPPHRTTAVVDGAVDRDAKAIHFSLAIPGRPPIRFIAEYGASTQIIGALGRMFLALQELVQAEKTGMAAVAAEQIAAAHIQQEHWTGNVIFQITTPTGIPYNFVMPPQVASNIADRLKIESAKPRPAAGSA